MAIKKDKRLTVDYWHKKATTDELFKVHRALAKRSNQRIVRLERAVSKVTGENYASYGAGDIAKEYLQKQGRKRFRETAQSSLRALDDAQKRHEILKDIKAMQEFLSSKSSTVTGQREIERKRLKTFETPKYDEEGNIIREPVKFASNKEFYDFLNSQTFAELSKTFNSDTVVELYDMSRDKGLNNEEIQNALDEYRQRTNLNEKGLREALGLKELE